MPTRYGRQCHMALSAATLLVARKTKKNKSRTYSKKSEVKTLTKDYHTELQDITTKPKGTDWDKDFVDKEIDGHKKVLDKRQDAKKATTNPELGEMLTKATAKVQEHL